MTARAAVARLMTAAALVGVSCGLSAAQPMVCAPREMVVTGMERAHGERRVGHGLDLSRGGVLELYAAEAGGWTLIVSLPDGMACILAAGEGWHADPPEIPGDPS